MSKHIEVLLVDDHALIRDGIAAVLKSTEDIIVAGSIATGEEAVNYVRTSKPDVILMDIMMRGMTGIEATRWIKEIEPSMKIILVSMEIKKEFLSAGIKSGIDGYIHKDSEKEILIDAIRTVHKGGRYFNEAITNLVFDDFFQHEKLGRAKEKRISKELTKREHEILAHIADGRSNKDVADALFISVKTVETHKSHILEKLGLKNTAELVKYAIKNNLIELE